MEYIYQIRASGTGYLEKYVLTQDIVTAESKREVLDYVEENYPEYFENNKVCQKLSKKTD